MKNYVLIILGLIIISSCHKDEIDTVVRTEDGEPIMIDNAYVIGRVLNRNAEPIPDVIIEVYQYAESLGTVYTNSDGDYSTNSITIDPRSPIILNYYKENFLNNFRKYEFEQSIIIEKDVTLRSGKAENECGVNCALDSSFVKIYGYCRLSNGQPMANVECYAIWKHTMIPPNGTFIERYTRGFSDLDGYFELFVPNDSTIHLSSYLYSCHFTHDVNITELGVFGSIELGIIEEDTNIDLYDRHNYQIESSTIRGKAINCDGIPVNSGDIFVSFNYDNGRQFASQNMKDVQFSETGEFEIEISTTCINIRSIYKLEVRIIDYDNNFSGSTVTDYDKIVDIGTMEMCIDTYHYDYEMSINLNGEITNFDQQLGGDSRSSGITRLETEFRWVDGDRGTLLKLIIDDIQLGNNDISYIQLSKGPDNGYWTEIQDIIFEEEPALNLTANITSIEEEPGRPGKWVTGTITGQVDAIFGTTDFNATFRIFDK